MGKSFFLFSVTKVFKGFFIVCQAAAFESVGAVYVHDHLFLGRDAAVMADTVHA